MVEFKPLKPYPIPEGIDRVALAATQYVILTALGNGVSTEDELHMAVESARTDEAGGLPRDIPTRLPNLAMMQLVELGLIAREEIHHEPTDEEKSTGRSRLPTIAYHLVDDAA